LGGAIAGPMRVPSASAGGVAAGATFGGATAGPMRVPSDSVLGAGAAGRGGEMAGEILVPSASGAGGLGGAAGRSPGVGAPPMRVASSPSLRRESSGSLAITPDPAPLTVAKAAG
jgi:hypothetical protein